MLKYVAKLARYWAGVGRAARMMVGLPDYDVYAEHMRHHHPDQPCMTYKEFFRERQEARYGGKSGGKCC